MLQPAPVMNVGARDECKYFDSKKLKYFLKPLSLLLKKCICDNTIREPSHF